MSQVSTLRIENRDRFVREWFDEGPRRLGTPNTRLIDSPEAALPWLDQRERPVWLSVSTFIMDNTVRSFDRLFLDFDSQNLNDAWIDARRFTVTITHNFDVEPFLVFSGKKGYHVYVFMSEPFGEDSSKEVISSVYRELLEMLIGAHSYPTLDRNVLQVTRLARVPYSIHEKTGNLVTPIDLEKHPLEPISDVITRLRENGIHPDIVKVALKRIEAKTRSRLQTHSSHNTLSSGSRRLRSCMEAVLNDPSVHGPAHKLNLAAAIEALCKGWSESEVKAKFSSKIGYDERRTEEQIVSAKRYQKPWRCSTIQSIGGCLPDCKYRKRGGASF